MVLWGYTKHDRHIAGDTHIPSDMSMGIHKPQGHPYHCDTPTIYGIFCEAVVSSQQLFDDYAVKTEGTFVCACVRRTMRGVRELRDFSQTQN